jgi:hypothetical protein
MFTSPLNRFVASDEDMQDDMAPTGESSNDNPRPSKKPGKNVGAQGSPKKRSGDYVFNKSHAPDGKPTEPIHFDGASAPGKRTKGVFQPGSSSGQKTEHENMRTNSGFGQKGGKFSDGGAEDYEDYRDSMSLGRKAKSKVSTKA